MKTLINNLFLFLLLFASCEKEKENNVAEIINLEDLTIKSYPNGVKNVFDMFFIDEQTGFVIGKEGMIKKTTNSGETWTLLISGTTVDLNSISFINDNVGFIGGDFIRNGEHFSSIFLKTTDGGLNWALDTIPGIARFQDIWFYNETDGIAFLQTEGSGDVVATTDDGGATWNHLNLNVVKNNWSWERIFVKDNDTYIIGGTDNHSIFKSTDLGRNWTTIQTPVLINEINFVSADIGYISGEAQFYRTENSGANWSKVTVHTHVGLFHFFNNGKGFNIDHAYEYSDFGDGVIPVASFVMTTRDGGLNWKNERIPNIIGGHYSYPSDKKGYFIEADKFYAIEFK